MIMFEVDLSIRFIRRSILFVLDPLLDSISDSFIHSYILIIYFDLGLIIRRQEPSQALRNSLQLSHHDSQLFLICFILQSFGL